MHAMDLMKENGLLFGTSICYTSANYKAVTSDEFMDMLIGHGVRFNWYFHYMPIGDGANVDLMLNAEQREYMIHRVREIRASPAASRSSASTSRTTASTSTAALPAAASMPTSTGGRR